MADLQRATASRELDTALGQAGDQITVSRASAATAAVAVREPSQRASDFAWRTLVLGLMIGLLASLGGLIFLVADGKPETAPDVLVTAFTAILTGVVGLFVQKPAAP